MEVILLERVKSLGQMGDRVNVKAGYARNFLLPQKKALRVNEKNIEKFESEKLLLEAKNLENKKEAEGLKSQIQGKKIVLIRSAAESGALYGSVTARDIQKALSSAGIELNKNQIELNATIKDLGVTIVPVNLHPELSVDVEINIARSPEEAAAQALKKNVSTVSEEDKDFSDFFEKEEDAPNDEENQKEANDETDKKAEEDSPTA